MSTMPWPYMFGNCPIGPHRGPQGPNEDLAQCAGCGSVSYAMRPEGETYGLHAADCSLPNRHPGHCEGGGAGHLPAPTVRGYWPNGGAEDAAPH